MVTITQNFAWNVEAYLQCNKLFEWYVGEGPLFWYRIEWKTPICTPVACTPSAISCVISTTNCDCPVPSYTAATSEVWHVMATSVADLCRRLNRDCCNRNLFKNKVFSKVQQYDRPVLCCDVDNFIISGIPITDEYYDVDFCECECVQWVDPCDCGNIITPCTDDVPYLPCAPASLVTYLSTDLTTDLFGLKAMVEPGFNVQIMKPNVDTVITKCGVLPSNLKLKHNLSKMGELNTFLSRNNLQLPEEVDLVYNKTSDIWHKSIHLNGHNEKWTILFSWNCSDMNVSVSKQIGEKRELAKIVIGYISHGIADGDKFNITFNYNVKTNKVIATHPIIIKTKTMHDEIGLSNLILNIFVGKK